MGDEEKEIDPIEQLEKKIDEQNKLLRDLIDYLERKDIIPQMDYTTFTDWQSELQDMRREEMRMREIESRKKYLEEEGYIVVKDKNELDAAILKHWTTSKDRLGLTNEEEKKDDLE